MGTSVQLSIAAEGKIYSPPKCVIALFDEITFWCAYIAINGLHNTQMGQEITLTG